MRKIQAYLPLLTFDCKFTLHVWDELILILKCSLTVLEWWICGVQHGSTTDQVPVRVYHKQWCCQGHRGGHSVWRGDHRWQRVEPRHKYVLCFQLTHGLKKERKTKTSMIHFIVVFFCVFLVEMLSFRVTKTDFFPDFLFLKIMVF